MLKEHKKPEAVISRLWMAVGIGAEDLPDDCVGEMLQAWLQALGDFTLDDLKRGVDAWKGKPITPTPEEFAQSISVKSKKTYTKKEIIQKAIKDSKGGDFDEAYDKLLRKTWGPQKKIDP